MIASYRSRETFEAVQWNGENKEEMKEFCGDNLIFDYYTNKPPVLTLNNRKANVFDYICKRGENFEIIPKFKFEERYEKI